MFIDLTKPDLQVVSIKKKASTVIVSETPVSSTMSNMPVIVSERVVQVPERAGNRVMDIISERPIQRPPVIVERVNRISPVVKRKPKPTSPAITQLLEELKNKDTPAHVFQCAICLCNAANNSELSSTRCGHIFCSPCLDASMKRCKKCPICRKAIPKNGFHRLYF